MRPYVRVALALSCFFSRSTSPLFAFTTYLARARTRETVHAREVKEAITAENLAEGILTFEGEEHLSLSLSRSSNFAESNAEKRVTRGRYYARVGGVRNCASRGARAAAVNNNTMQILYKTRVVAQRGFIGKLDTRRKVPVSRERAERRARPHKQDNSRSPRASYAARIRSS